MSDDILPKFKCVNQGKTIENKKIKMTRRSDAKSFPKIKFKNNYFITSPNAGTPLDQQQNGRTQLIVFVY